MDGATTLARLQAHPAFIRIASVRDDSQVPPLTRVPGASAKAIQATADWREAVSLVQALGTQRFAEAVPTLALLWRAGDIVPVQIAAGHALFAIGTADAHAALRSTLESGEHIHRFLAVKSVVACEGETAFETLAPHLDERRLYDSAALAIAADILAFFGPASEGPSGRAWWLPGVPHVLRSDSRWMRAGLRLRHDRRLEDSARKLLSSFDASELEEGLRRWPDPPPLAPKPWTGPRDLLARYEAGGREEVWRTLWELGPIANSALREEALAVARAMMRRVRSCVETVTDRLARAGYPFDVGSPAWSVPPPDATAQIEALERAAGGPCPLSLRAFWEVVGAVNWKWREDAVVRSAPWGDALELAEADPLYVDGVASSTWYVDEWRDRLQEEDPIVVGPLMASLAPDYLHKANISGGAPYEIRLPNAAADGLFENEEHELPFVEYLRLTFARGGFSRLELGKLDAKALAFVEGLRRGLEPF